MPPKGSAVKRKAKAAAPEESGDDESPKQHKNKQKQKQDASDEDDDNEKPSAAKKSKKAPKEPVKPLDPSIPTNVTFPIEVSFASKKAGTTRLSCWNGGPSLLSMCGQVADAFDPSLRHQLLRKEGSREGHHQ